MAGGRFVLGVNPDACIHSMAHVQGAVTIGPRTRVWQFASVTGGTVLGADCVVWPFAMLDGPRFGDRCKIASGVAMGPGFLFGDDCFVGPNVTVCNDRWPRAHTRGFDIGLLRSGKWTVLVGNEVSIGANAVVLPGVVIGHGAMIAAGAVVDCNVPERHLFHRGGFMEPIRDGWEEKRMRISC